MNKEIEKLEPMAVVPAEPMTPLQLAIESKADPEQLLKFMELQERWEANEARKAYVVAMNEFKKNPPDIHKNKTVEYNDTKYDHASLDNVTDIIVAALAEHGFSHRWNTEQLEGGQIRVTCVITHSMGHSESTPLQSGPDQSGGKNNIQAVGSTLTYLQRYTLLSATGLAVKGMDNDGQTSEPVERITEDQAKTIHALITDNDLNMDRFMKKIRSGFNIDVIADITVDNYKRVIKQINAAIDARNKQMDKMAE